MIKVLGSGVDDCIEIRSIMEAKLIIIRSSSNSSSTTTTHARLLWEEISHRYMYIQILIFKLNNNNRRK